MDRDDLRTYLIESLSREADVPRGASVLAPFVMTDQGPSILLEVRALSLDIQPGDVCLPGGHVEEGESPEQTAIRETCEELLVDEHDIELVGSLGNVAGPGGRPLHVFVGLLNDYRGTFSPDEVDHTFTLPLDWLLSHEPTLYDVALEPRHPDDFPWDRIVGGRSYPWRAQHQLVPFYLETEPLVWGATARVLWRLAQRLRRQ